MASFLHMNFLLSTCIHEVYTQYIYMDREATAVVQLQTREFTCLRTQCCCKLRLIVQNNTSKDKLASDWISIDVRYVAESKLCNDRSLEV